MMLDDRARITGDGLDITVAAGVQVGRSTDISVSDDRVAGGGRLIIHISNNELVDAVRSRPAGKKVELLYSRPGTLYSLRSTEPVLANRYLRVECERGA